MLDQAYLPETARAALLYTASRVSWPSCHKLSQLLYLADLFHLQSYGQLMFGGDYQASQSGPIHLQLHTLIDRVQQEPGSSTRVGFKVEENYLGCQGETAIIPLEHPNLMELSDSILECLDESLLRYEQAALDDLTKLTNDAAWSSTQEHEVIPLTVLAATLPNADALLRHLRNPHP